MDRVAPSRRPTDRALQGYQSWRELLFVHWPVEADALRPLVPQELDLDDFEGRHLVGVIVFAMEGVRPRWAPRATSFDFLEVNVRCYVHRRGDRPGVYFLSLDAASWIAVHVARLGWSLPYYFASMERRRDGDRVRYTVERREPPRPTLDARWCVSGGADAPPTTAAAGTLEHFLVERYLLYVPRRGALWVGQVHHRPYPLVDVTEVAIEESLVSAAGLSRPSTPPPLVHYSPGVDVEIFELERVGALTPAQGSR